MPHFLRILSRRLVRNPPVSFRVALLLAAVLTYGSTGFLYFEIGENPSLTWPDGVWYAFVTVTTVGYGDLFPKTPGGRFLVAVPLMFFGIGLLGYVLSLAASVLIEAKTKELRGMSKFDLSGHVVIFNFPSLGKVLRLLDELHGDATFPEGADIVLVDEKLEELPPELVKRGVHFVRGSPTRDDTLDRAAIDRARFAVVLCVRPGDPHSDDLNVAITLAVEARNDAVRSVVECVEPEAEELLRKAGCDSIVCTATFGAPLLSSELLRPGVQGVFAQLASAVVGEQVYLARHDGKKAVSFRALAEACRASDHVAIGIRDGSETRLNPGDDHAVEPGVQVVTIGRRPLGTIAAAD